MVPTKPNPLWPLLAIAAGLVLSITISNSLADVYGHRIDEQGTHHRWLTQIQSKQGVEFKSDKWGTVFVTFNEETGVVRVKADGNAEAYDVNVSVRFAAPNVADVQLVNETPPRK
jgi:hypothetical protein